VCWLRYLASCSFLGFLAVAKTASSGLAGWLISFVCRCLWEAGRR